MAHSHSKTHFDPEHMDFGSSPKPSQHRLVGISSMIGTTIEWYDFFIYGSAAALIFNKLFFPTLDPLSGILAAFATYTVGFIGRPLGGILFGHFGDRIGRKSMLLLTLLLMGIPTILIGLLPTYSSIGYWAAVLLVILRFIQGMAMGGEWGGAVLMAVEHAPKDKKGFWGSLPQTSVGAGMFLASSALILVSFLPEQQLFAWGWRIPFIASVILLIVGWYIRIRVPESPEFEKVKQAAQQVRYPTAQVVRQHPRQIIYITLARAAENGWFYMSSTFVLAYATTQLGMARSSILFSIVCGAGLSMLVTPIFGYISDKIGQRRLFLAGLFLLALYAFPFFYLLDSKQPQLIWGALVFGIGILFSMMYAPEAMLFARQFPVEIRYSGISIAVQFAGVIGGGLAPMIATKLLSIGQGNSYLISIYILATAIIAMICTLLMKSDSEEEYH